MAKRIRSFCILHSAFCIVLVAAAAHGAATATSQAFAVDSRDGELRALAPGDIGYSPSWCGVTEPGSYVVIEKIEHAGMSNAATSSVTNAPDTEGSYQFSPAVGGERCFRLVHRAYDANGDEIGTALVRDIAIGFASAPGDATIADGHGDLLQREAVLGKVVGLTYDSSWATNADTVAISAVQLKDGRGRDLATPVTNALFSTAETAPGTFDKALKSGGWRFLHTSFDKDGNIICAPYFADYFLKTKGTAVMLQ